MKLALYTAPIIEPVSLAEFKLHLRYDGGSFADNIDTTQSIAPGSHAIANEYTTHAGAAVDVLGYNAVVNLISGTNGATGTVDCKIQESDNGTTWTDVTSGAFTQVTTATDNATYEKAYTGTKQYIRTVAKVLLAACEFGTTIIRFASTSVEDDLLTEQLYTAREVTEQQTQRAFLTQVWDAYLECWPSRPYLQLPFGNLQDVVGTQSVSYTDSAGAVTTLAKTTDYLWETNGDQHGRIVLPYGGCWPGSSLYPSNPIHIRFVCGWTAAASVPRRIKSLIKMVATDLYKGRGEVYDGRLITENKTTERLMWQSRLWGALE